jgi:hypothetical protein
MRKTQNGIKTFLKWIYKPQQNVEMEVKEGWRENDVEVFPWNLRGEI